jgi:hypothetical protein
MTEEKLVTVGQHVKAGDVVGRMGNSGFVVSGGVPYWGQANPDKKGTHLHWTVKRMIPVETGQPSNEAYLNQAYKVINNNNGFQGAFDNAELFKGKTMIELVQVGNTFYLELNGQTSIGIATMDALEVFTSAGVQAVSKSSVAPQVLTLTGNGFVLHKI